MPYQHASRILQPQRLRRNMLRHRVQIAYAPFQGTVTIESRRPSGSVHGHDACSPDSGGVQTGTVERRSVLGRRQLAADGVPQRRHAGVKVAPGGSDRRAGCSEVGKHIRALVYRGARINGDLGAQYVECDGYRRACHAQELGANASNHHRNNGQLGQR